MLGICHTFFTLRKNNPLAYYVFTYQEKGVEIAVLVKLLLFLKIEENQNSDMVTAKSLEEVEVTLRKQLLGGFFISTSSLFL